MASSPRRCPRLVLGIGNILMGDEGVGVRVIEAMQSADWPPDVELVDGGTAGADLIDVMSDRQTLIVIDAVDADVPPGTVVRLTPDELASSNEPGISLHEIGLLETLAMTRQLGTAPEEIIILGIQPKRIHPSTELSEELRAVVPAVVEQVLQELKT